MGKISVSQKRIDANRRNALRSTGPKTDEGKAKSRLNSLVHGLAGEGLVMPGEDGQAVAERAAQLNSSLRPFNTFEMGLVETYAVEAIRIERCRIEERVVREVRARQAAVCWAEDRRAEVEALARSLPNRPAEVSRRLLATAPGCEWMIDRWRALGHALDKNGGWDEAQRARALDLLGVADDLRDLPNPADAPDGDDAVEHRQGLVDAQLERLWARKREGLDDAEEGLRESAKLGLNVADDRALVLLRRYETAAHRRQKWAYAQLIKRGHNVADPARKWDDPDEPAWKGNARHRLETFPAPIVQPYARDVADRSHHEPERSHCEAGWHDPLSLAGRLERLIKAPDFDAEVNADRFDRPTDAPASGFAAEPRVDAAPIPQLSRL